MFQNVFFQIKTLCFLIRAATPNCLLHSNFQIEIDWCLNCQVYGKEYQHFSFEHQESPKIGLSETP